MDPPFLLVAPGPAHNDGMSTLNAEPETVRQQILQYNSLQFVWCHRKAERRRWRRKLTVRPDRETRQSKREN